MTKNDTETPAAPAFETVAVADLPAATKVVQPDTIALGQAMLAVIGGGSNAAQEATVHAERKAATARAAVLKRALNAAGVPDGFKPGTRIITVDGGFKVAAIIVAVKPAAEPQQSPAE